MDLPIRLIVQIKFGLRLDLWSDLKFLGLSVAKDQNELSLLREKSYAHYIAGHSFIEELNC